MVWSRQEPVACCSTQQTHHPALTHHPSLPRLAQGPLQQVTLPMHPVRCRSSTLTNIVLVRVQSADIAGHSEKLLAMGCVKSVMHISMCMCLRSQGCGVAEGIQEPRVSLVLGAGLKWSSPRAGKHRKAERQKKHVAPTGTAETGILKAEVRCRYLHLVNGGAQVFFKSVKCRRVYRQPPGSTVESAQKALAYAHAMS